MVHILATLAFFATYNNWHSFANDRSTRNAVASLEKRGYLKVDWPTRTAKFTGKCQA